MTVKLWWVWVGFFAGLDLGIAITCVWRHFMRSDEDHQRRS